MKRRTFIQWLIGILTIGIKGKTQIIPTPPPKVGDLYFTNHTEHKRKYIGDTNLNMNDSIYNIPDKIVAITEFKGRIIVACEHSVWEIIDKDSYLARKQIKI